MENIDELNLTEMPALYKHSKKQEWGLAILAWEKDGRRGYQFEDGELRVFKDGYYQLLEEVDKAEGDKEKVAGELLQHLGRALQQEKREESGGSKPLMSFDEQLMIFKSLYADGFGGDAWKKDVRGIEAKRRLKKHRAPALTEAAELMVKDDLAKMIESEQYAEVCEKIAKVWSGTDLVSSKMSKELDGSSDAVKERVAKASFDLLYGEGEYSPRFMAWLRALRSAVGTAGWQVATVLQSLVYPKEHVCVRPSSFRDQAAWIAPRITVTSRPDAVTYNKLREMSVLIEKKLGENGLAASDMLDVHDFIWATLRPAARSILDNLKAK